MHQRVVLVLRLVLPILLTLLEWATAHAQATYNAQIHNAPGWQPNTTYTYSAGPPSGHFTRVLAGGGWTPSGGTSGTWSNGQPLNAYQLLNTSSPCVSGSGTPAGGWDVRTDIIDGTCHWKYLSAADYVTFTGWALDSGLYWSSGTDYFLRDVVVAGPNSDVYQQLSAGCHSTVQPNNTRVPQFQTSDNCIWSLRGTVYYTSKNNAFPHERFWRDTFQGYITPATASFTGYITAPTTLTVTNVSSGAIYTGMPISGTGVDAGQYISGQKSGTSGGVGVYSLRNWNSVSAPSTTMTSTYGSLAVTVQPTKHQLASPTTGILDMLSSASMAAGNVGNDQQGGTKIIAGSGSAWAVNISQTVGSAANPVTFYLGDLANADVGTTAVYHAQLWNDREYVSGQNGEAGALTIWNHNWAYNDAVTGHLPQALRNASCPDRWGCLFFIEAAPGEGFGDTFAADPSLPLTGYNANNGVALRGVGTAALLLKDNAFAMKRLQLSSNMSSATLAPERGCNNCFWEHNILEGGTGGQLPYSPDAVTNCGAGCFWQNNLFIVRGALGVAADYGGAFYNNTFVCRAASPCWSPMDNTWNWANSDGMAIYGNAVFGFQHFTTANFYGNGWTGDCTWNCATVMGTNNATDLPATEGKDFPASHKGVDYALPFYTGSAFNSAFYRGPTPICGFLSNGKPTAGVCEALRSVAPNTAFVSWPDNLRINPTGPLIGAGAAYDRCALPPNGFLTAYCTIVPVNTPDLFGTARPQSGRYDIGAVQMFTGDVGATSPASRTARPQSRSR
jgi:hypothetical protein